MDDLDANIRRNLVAVSTAILLGTYLEVPLGAVLLKWLAPEGVSIPGHKLIAMGYGLLLYFALRFRLSDGIQQLLRDGPNRVQQDRLMAFFDHVQGLFFRHCSGRPADPIFRGELTKVLEEKAEKYGVPTGQPPVASHLSLDKQIQPPWHIGLSIRASWKAGATVNDLHLYDEAGSVEVKATGVMRFWITASVYIRSALYTDVGMQRDIPVFLCLGAELALAVQFARLAGW